MHFISVDMKSYLWIEGRKSYAYFTEIIFLHLSIKNYLSWNFKFFYFIY